MTTTDLHFTYAQVEAAMALWEAVIEAERVAASTNKQETVAWCAWRDKAGTTAFRWYMANVFAVACSDDWHEWGGSEQDLEGEYPTFDWDFCPAWLQKCIDWTLIDPRPVAPLKRRERMLARYVNRIQSDNLTQMSQTSTDELLAEMRTYVPQQVPVCSNCQSAEISAEAGVMWDPETRRWVCDDICDKTAQCAKCGAVEMRPDWRPVVVQRVMVQEIYTVSATKIVEVMAPTPQAACDKVQGDEIDGPVTAFDPGDGWTFSWAAQAGRYITGAR